MRELDIPRSVGEGFGPCGSTLQYLWTVSQRDGRVTIFPSTVSRRTPQAAMDARVDPPHLETICRYCIKDPIPWFAVWLLFIAGWLLAEVWNRRLKGSVPY